jgi:hypothetical protein
MKGNIKGSFPHLFSFPSLSPQEIEIQVISTTKPSILYSNPASFQKRWGSFLILSPNAGVSTGVSGSIGG